MLNIKNQSKNKQVGKSTNKPNNMQKTLAFNKSAW